MKAFIGCDPGASGALVMLTEDRRKFVHRFSQNEIEQTRDTLLDWRLEYAGVTAALEKATSRPSDDPYSAFVFGYNYGTIYGLFVASYIPVELIPAKRWQLSFGLGGKQGPAGCTQSQEYAARKRAHKARVETLLGEKVVLEEADARLIAEYKWRKEMGYEEPEDMRVRRPAMGIVRVTKPRIRY